MADLARHFLRGLAELGGAPVAAIQVAEQPWASITFSGARFRITVATTQCAADRIASGLSDHEFTVPGHIVADIALSERRDAGDEAELRIEALVLEAC